MEKSANIQNETTATNQGNRKSWSQLEEEESKDGKIWSQLEEEEKKDGKSWSNLEEESKDVKYQMMMQPQDYIPQVAEAGKDIKIHQITEAYEQETSATKKTLKRAK